MDSTFYILGSYALVYSAERKMCRVFKQEANSKKLILSVCNLLGLDAATIDKPNICDELVSTYGVNFFLELGNNFICSSSFHQVQTYSLCSNPRKALEQVSSSIEYPDSIEVDNYTLCCSLIDYCKNNPTVLERLSQERNYLHDVRQKAEEALSASVSIAKEAVPLLMQAGMNVYAKCGDFLETFKESRISRAKSDSTNKVDEDDLYGRAISLIEAEYPSLYEHVALKPGGVSERISLAYDSKNVILYQKGYVITFPCDKDLRRTLDEITSNRKGVVDIQAFKAILNSKGIKPSVKEYDTDPIDIELNGGEIIEQQPDKVVKEHCSVSDCKECKGKGYLPCPDKECRGRHKYTCPNCKGEGKRKCSVCNATGEVRCPTCKGAGQYTCEQCKGEGEFQCRDCKGKGQVKCSSCKGKGRTRCRHCNGLGKMQNGDKCTVCYGDGYLKCQKCNGAGEYKCVSCNGRGVNTCTTCHGEGIVICRTCHGDKKIECRACSGRGESTCYKCNGGGIIICPTCLGDKEHYGMIGCKKCDTLGMLGHLCYVHSDISTQKKTNIPTISCNRKRESFDQFVNFPELKLVYKNINSKKMPIKDEAYIEVSNEVNSSLGIDFKSQNPCILKQSLTYQKFVSVLITCRHIVSNVEFDICVMDINGPKPLVVFPDHDHVTFEKSGLFKRIGLANAKFFNTEKYRNRVDKFNSVKAYLLMAKIGGKIGPESRPLLLRLINGVDDLVSEQKEILYLILNSDTTNNMPLKDLEFTTKDVANEVYANLKTIAEVDGQMSSEEENFLKKFHSKFVK